MAAFSLEPDVTRLVDAVLVAPDWAKDAQKGMVSNSVVVLAVRKDNPKRIKGWDDLVRDDVEVITPNPFTSGGARWNVMAAYGAQLRTGKSEDEAIEPTEPAARRGRPRASRAPRRRGRGRRARA